MAMQQAEIVECSRFVDDGEPWQYLRARGFRQKFGLMKSPIDHKWSTLDREAVNYLCKEWEWTWSGQEV